MDRERLARVLTEGRVEETIKLLTAYRKVLHQAREEAALHGCPRVEQHARLCWEWACTSVNVLLQR